MIVPHSRPSIEKQDIDAVAAVLSSGKIAQGEKVEEFEKAFRSFIRVKYAVACSSGTSAIHLALMGLGVHRGDRIILPSYVCASPYLAIRYTDAVPEIVDINPIDFNICAKTAKMHLTRKTKAIIVPHMFGTPANIDDLIEVGIPVIEDCAQSHGARYNGIKVGSFGDASIFSFYATKMITTGEGGMILTNDKDLYRRFLALREYDKKPQGLIAFNYKMTDMQAALGLSQLARLNHFIERRKQIASVYSENFSDCDIKIPFVGQEKDSVFYRYVVLTRKRRKVERLAKEKGVFCERPVFRPLHRESKNDCPNTDRVYSEALSIPIYPSLSEREINYVLGTMKSIFHNALKNSM
jgi:dTDP-4-amino-4,6-dideoxygalactose transaminase